MKEVVMRIPLYRLAGLFFTALLVVTVSVGVAEEVDVESAVEKEELEELIEPETEEAQEATGEEAEEKVYFEDVVKVGESLVVEENEVVKGDVVCIGGTLRIAGTVRGDAVCVGGTMRLDSTAVIRGDAVAVGGSIDRHDDATIKGESISIGMPILPELFGLSAPCRITRVTRAASSPFPAFFGMFLFVLVIAVLVSAFLPNPTKRLETVARRSFWKTLLIGLLGEVLILPFFILLFISIIGWALIPLAAIALAAAFYFGKTGVSLLVGNMFFSRFKSKLPHIVGSTALGVLLIYSLWIVGGIIAYGVGALGGMIIALGCIVMWVAWTTGLGAVILTRFGTRLPADLQSESGVESMESA
jgi:hypothetical protein